MLLGHSRYGYYVRKGNQLTRMEIQQIFINLIKLAMAILK